jgi:tetratricopeptide (TPR) repeat protein
VGLGRVCVFPNVVNVVMEINVKSVLCFLGVAALALTASCKEPTRSRVREEVTLAPIPKTTDGAVAIGNLDAMIAGHEKRVANAPGDVPLRAGLVELLLSRAQFLGTIADVERASEIAEGLVREAAKRPESWIARASTNATWHRFDAASEDLAAAERAGAPAKSLRAARASILAATGRLDEALAMAPSNGDLAGDSMALAGRGLLEGELGRMADAEGDLGAARSRYRDVSPLPLAWMDATQAAVYEKRGDRVKAHVYYTRAVRILPAYAKAVAHLASYETAERAVAILEPVAVRSDDPEVHAELGDALRRVGRHVESEQSLARARSRYEALLAKHPEAFADHAARFWLGAGADPARALPLAAANVKNRPTAEAFALWLDAAEAARDDASACQAARRLAALPHASDAQRVPARARLGRCPPPKEGT